MGRDAPPDPVFETQFVRPQKARQPSDRILDCAIARRVVTRRMLLEDLVGHGILGPPLGSDPDPQV